MDDSTLWQAPGLALAAQAFLLTIALADKGTRFNRITAAVLALCTAGAAIYLILRKRAQRQVAETELKEVVKRLYRCKDEDINISFEDRVRGLPDTYPSTSLRFVKRDAQTVWGFALGVFALVDLLVIGMAALRSPWLVLQPDFVMFRVARRPVVDSGRRGHGLDVGGATTTSATGAASH